MRGLSLLAVLAIGALVLSGCSSKDTSTTSTSGTASHSTLGKNGTKGTGGNSTVSLPPNIPPMVKLTITNSTGVATNVTFRNGSLVFSAEGSMDPDADGLSAVAITAQDSNRTYPPGVLFAAGKFTSVTYTFDHPGPVNVTVSGIDGRGDLTTITSKVYVDEKFTASTSTITFPSTGGHPADVTKCHGPAKEIGNGVPTVPDSDVYLSGNFNVAKGVSFVTATYTTGTGAFAICFFDSKADTDTMVAGPGSTGQTLTTTTALKVPIGLDQYSIGFTAGKPDEAQAAMVVVHYEPKPAK